MGILVYFGRVFAESAFAEYEWSGEWVIWLERNGAWIHLEQNRRNRQFIEEQFGPSLDDVQVHGV